MDWRRPREGPDHLAALEETYGEGLRELVRHSDADLSDSYTRDPDWDGSPMPAGHYFSVIEDLACGSSLTGWDHDRQLGWVWKADPGQRRALVARACREVGGSFEEQYGR